MSDDNENKAKSDQELLELARKQLKRCIDAEGDEREKALDDLKFLDGDQWPADVKQSRDAEGLPCLTINKLPAHLDQVVGDQRQNRPAIKVRPVDNKADPETATIYEGMIRGIERNSQADIPRDHAFEHAGACGRGAYRVITQYSDDDVFDQDILIKKIDNPFSVFWDPAAVEYDRSDARFAFIVEDMDKTAFEEEFGIKPPEAFTQADGQYLETWMTSGTIRVAEWFRKVPATKTLYLLEDGSTVENKVPKGMRSTRSRKVKSHKILWYKISGNKILSGPKDWPGKYIPIVPVWGKELNVGGKRKIRGLVRHAKDPQRMYNYWRSKMTEVVALAPKSPWLVTPKMIRGFEGKWRDAHKSNFAYMPFNADPDVRGMKPFREQPGQIPTGLANEINVSDQEIRDTTGIQKAGLGMVSNEKSGIAIRERKQEGDVGTYAYQDNLARSVTFEGKILVDLIPKIYDSERVVRYGLVDGTDEYRTVNKEVTELDNMGGTVTRIFNDITIGKYDVAVTVGPSYTTQRTEAASGMIDLIGKLPPEQAMVITDKVVESLDWPGADEIAKRIKKTLPPGIIDVETESSPGAGGTQNATPGPPPPGPAQPPAPPPEVQAQMQMEMEMGRVKLAQEAEKLKGLQIENQIKEAELMGKKESIAQMIQEMLAGPQEAPAPQPGEAPAPAE